MKSGGGDGGASQARADEQARQQRIREGTTRINEQFGSQFTDDYYNKRRDDFLTYAKPQLESQFSDAKKQLMFALDRNRVSDSSIRAAKEADLQQLYETNSRSVADQALSYANTARNNVEDSRNNLISTLNATGDAEGAINSASARAKALTAPDTYSPLAQLFTTFTGSLGQQAALEKAAAASGGQYGGAYNTGLFAPRKQSVQVT